MRVAGIDPGAKGAIAIIDTITGVATVEDLPFHVMVRPGKKSEERNVLSSILFRCQLTRLAPDFVQIEYVHGEYLWSATTNFWFGRSYGAILLALDWLGIAYETLDPGTWKRAVGLPPQTKSKQRKRDSVELASSKWPDLAHLFNGPRGGLFDGRAEALLIASYKNPLLVSPHQEDLDLDFSR